MPESLVVGSDHKQLACDADVLMKDSSCRRGSFVVCVPPDLLLKVTQQDVSRTSMPCTTRAAIAQGTLYKRCR